MSVDPIAQLEARAQVAEDAWRRGDFRRAWTEYKAAVVERLVNSTYGVDEAARLTAADFVVIERLADLARLFGHYTEADELLAVAVNQIGAAGNRFWADLLHVKRIDLALGRGQLRRAQTLLDALRSSIGDVREIEFTPSGLEMWERRCQWPATNERDRALVFTLLHLIMGRLLAALGQYAQAEEAFERGLEHAVAPDAPGLAQAARPQLQLALAAALLERGELQLAATRLSLVAPQLDERKQPATHVHALELQGKLHLLAGEFGAALERFRAVLAVCEQRGFARATTIATLNLAHALIFLNQTTDARRLLRAARADAHARGDDATVMHADWLLQLAAARGHSLADGVPIAPTVTEQWDAERTTTTTNTTHDEAATRTDADAPNPLDLPQSDNYLAFFEDRALGFHWLLGRRDLRACAAYLARLQAVFAHTDSALIKLRLQVLAGLLAYYQDDLPRAESTLEAARPELRRLNLRPELWQAQRVLGWCRLKLSRNAAAQEELAAENDQLLAAMTRTLAAEDRAFFLLNKWTAEEELLAAEINRLSRLKAELMRASWPRRLRLRWQLTTRLDALLRLVDRYRDVVAQRTTNTQDEPQSQPNSATTNGAMTNGATTNDATRPQASLRESRAGTSLWRRLWQSRRRATISFLVLPDRVLVVRRSWFALDFGVSPATRIEVRELVRRWHELIARVIQEYSRGLGARPQAAPQTPAHDKTHDAPPTDSAHEARLIAEQLSRVLQLPATLDSLPRATRELTLVPDDSLHGFPFAAVTHHGRYLVEQYALSFAYSSNDAPPPNTRRPARRAALLVGAAHGGGAWAALPFVPQELNRVAGWAAQRRLDVLRLDAADTSADAPASPDKGAVMAALPQVALAHFACHGQFTPDAPAQSGIVVRPATDGSGVLSVQELSALDLSSLGHVTLSACWSADHFILPGRWVISLPETLARAGAGSVLGCLWLVDDQIGTAFMAQFYRHLNTHTRAEALRRTQLACLTGQLEDAPTRTTAQPIFWAGYQLYGRGDALQL